MTESSNNIKVLTLRRKRTSDAGTFGALNLPDGHALMSGELPWRENKPNLSCIPAGIYQCEASFSEHFQRMLYHVLNVAGRDHVMIHPANYMGDTTKINPAMGHPYHSDLLGCIALGQSIGSLDGQEAIQSSRSAILMLHDAMEMKPFEIHIINMEG